MPRSATLGKDMCKSRHGAHIKRIMIITMWLCLIHILVKPGSSRPLQSTVQCTLHIAFSPGYMLSTMYIAYITDGYVQCTLHILRTDMYTVHCIYHVARIILYIKCTLYISRPDMYNVHCTYQRPNTYLMHATNINLSILLYTFPENYIIK
jgi:hypothetical protein